MELSQVLQAVDIDGLIPALDSRQVGKAHARAARNVKYNAQGPQSGWGSRYLAKTKLLDAVLFKTFRVNDNIVLAGTDGLYDYDVLSETFYPLGYFGAHTALKWPWFMCEINNKFYFCRKGIGIYKYDPITASLTPHTPVGIPDNPVAVCQANGRLIVLGDGFVAWSAQEDTDDFVPSLATGAGQQTLAILGGEPFGLYPLADGFLTSTSKGFIFSEFSNNAAVFRHRVLTRSHQAINPFCITEIAEGQILFIDRKGFFVTTGRVPEEWNPLFSEFLNQTLLSKRDLADHTSFRLHIASDQRTLLLSIGLQADTTVGEFAYAIYLPTLKVGIFNDFHYGFGEIQIAQSAFAGFNFGYIDDEFRLRTLTGENFVENTILPDTGYHFQAEFDMPARIEDGIAIFPSLFHVSAEREYLFAGLPSGWYVVGGASSPAEFGPQPDDMPAYDDAGIWVFPSDMVGDGNSFLAVAEAVEMGQGGLDSYIEIGLMRFTQLQYDDELGMVTNVSIASEDNQQDEEDYMTVPDGEDDQDWNLMSGDEDWGIGSGASDEFEVTLIGTNDGSNDFTGNRQVLQDLSVHPAQTHFYPSFATGLFHVLRLDASEFPRTFHIKTIELSGQPAGRL